MYLGMWRPPGDHREQSTGAERLVRFRGGEGFCSSRATPGIHGRVGTPAAPLADYAEGVPSLRPAVCVHRGPAATFGRVHRASGAGFRAEGGLGTLPRALLPLGCHLLAPRRSVGSKSLAVSPRAAPGGSRTSSMKPALPLCARTRSAVPGGCGPFLPLCGERRGSPEAHLCSAVKVLLS